jgi:dCTP deaminase
VTYSDTDILAALQRGESRGESFAIDNWIRVQPFDVCRLQPASIDLRLGTEFVCFRASAYIDMGDRVVPSYPVNIGTGRDSYFELKPGQLALGTTIETIEVAARVWASIEGKSSMGRMGLAVHVTAGFIDPGFSGQVTLELLNVGPSPIRLRPGLAICQVAFGECKTRARRPYGSPGLGSRYQNQTGAVPVKP